MDTTQLYKQVIKDIKDKIISGDLKPGEKLPSENELLEIYNASKTTISKSLTILANEGYITTVPRVGNYVSEPKEDIYYLNNHAIEMMDSLWNKVEISNYDIIKQDNLMHLSLSKLFFVDNKVICSDHKFISFNGDFQFDQSKLLYSSLSDLLALTCDTFNIKKLITIEASFCPADIALELKISESEIVLIIQTSYFNDKGDIIGKSKTYYKKEYINIIASN